MFIRKAIVMALPALAVVVALPVAAVAQDAASAGQDAASVLQAVRGAIGKELPTRVRITAGGSGYVPPGGDSASQRHYRIESYIQELDLEEWTATERVERIEPAEGGNGSPEAEKKTVNAKAPWPEQHALWITPLGFLTGAGSRPVTVASETFLGTPYRVLSFTTPDGHSVRAYVTANNVLERARTEVGDLQVESVFMDWQDFEGLKYPSLVIEKTNGKVGRILVVTDVERF